MWLPGPHLDDMHIVTSAHPEPYSKHTQPLQGRAAVDSVAEKVNQKDDAQEYIQIMVAIYSRFKDIVVVSLYKVIFSFYFDLKCVNVCLTVFVYVWKRGSLSY